MINYAPMAISDVTTGITNLGTAFGSAIDMLSSNVVLMMLLGAGVVRVCFRLFKRARKSVA